MTQPKIYHLVGGLPRAGSTLLMNVLAQNPRFHATHTSGCMDVMFGVRNTWNRLVEHRAHPDEACERRVLRGILDAYHADKDEPVVFDKCRGWPSLIEMAEWVLDASVKILVPVRDLRDVLASFEKLWRDQARKGQVAGEAENYFQMQTLEGRLEFWTRQDQPVGLAFNRIKDALRRNCRDRLHFVKFEELTGNPEECLRKIYGFLDEPLFEHDFENVRQVTAEDDGVHGFDGLHEIRPKIEPMPPQYPKVLGEAAERYANLNFWDQL